MCKFNPKNDSRRIDPCMVEWIKPYQDIGKMKILACCCGHRRYSRTIVVQLNRFGIDGGFEILSGIFIPRKKKFYKKDTKGCYYIPEVEDNQGGAEDMSQDHAGARNVTIPSHC